MKMPNIHSTLPGAFLMLLTSFAGFACSRPSHAATDLPAAADDIEVEATDESRSAVAVLAGGCFWCTEAVFERLEGVDTVVSGYAGGAETNANYSAVSGGSTEHAEAIAITYNPAVISYGRLLRIFFAVAHDPTQLNRQGNDIGKQYRSTVFYANDQEKQVAQAYIKQLDEAGVFDKPIATTLESLNKFYPAEDYHQDYSERNPNDGYVRAIGQPKVEKLLKQFPELIKSAQ